MGERSCYTRRLGANRQGPSPFRRFHARRQSLRRRYGAAGPGVVLALGRNARSGHLDRPGDGLRPFDVDHLAVAGFGRGVRPVGGTPGQPYVGTGPLSWAHTSAKLHSEAERSLADEAAGPLAQLLAIPQDGGDGSDDDPLKDLKADIRTARGKALLLETSQAGWGEGRVNSPQRDWTASRLGPMPSDSMVKAADSAFMRVLAACGVPPSLFVSDDGTAQREAVRRWHMNTVLPLARLVEAELTEKLEVSVKLRFDNYAMDMVSRAGVVDKLVRAGVPIATAMAAVGLEEEG